MHFAKKQCVRVSIRTEVQIVSQGTITAQKSAVRSTPPWHGRDTSEYYYLVSETWDFFEGR